MIVLFIDQGIKAFVINSMYKSSLTIIKGILNFTYVENTGGAYGIGSNNTIIFILTNIIVLGVLIIYALLKRDKLDKKIIIAIALIISGGIGNLIDRIFRGFVVDYIDFNPLIKFPVFNVADIAVVLGCIIIGICIIIEMIKKDD